MTVVKPMRARAVVEALGLAPGDPTDIVLRANPMVPAVSRETGQPQMALMRWFGHFRGVDGEYILLDDPDTGTRYAWPESEVIVGKARGGKVLEGDSGGN
jgi:hypothetical protein